MTKTSDRYLVIMDPLDEELCALRRSIEILGHKPVTLHLVTFVHDPVCATGVLKDSEAKTLKEKLLADAETELERIASDMDFRELSYRIDAIWSKTPHKWINDRHEKKPYEAVFKRIAHDRRRSFERGDRRLIRDCAMPVVYVKKRKWPPRGSMIACIDLEHTRGEYRKVNQRVLEEAKYMADLIDGKVQCVYAYPVSTVLMELDIISRGEYEINAKRKYLPKLESLVKSITKGDTDFSCSVLPGQAEKEIPRLADTIKANMVILARHQRPGVIQGFIGSTAEKMLDNINCDILVI